MIDMGPLTDAQKAKAWDHIITLTDRMNSELMDRAISKGKDIEEQKKAVKAFVDSFEKLVETCAAMARIGL